MRSAPGEAAVRGRRAACWSVTRKAGLAAVPGVADGGEELRGAVGAARGEREERQAKSDVGRGLGEAQERRAGEEEVVRTRLESDDGGVGAQQHVHAACADVRADVQEEAAAHGAGVGQRIQCREVRALRPVTFAHNRVAQQVIRRAQADRPVRRRRQPWRRRWRQRRPAARGGGNRVRDWTRRLLAVARVGTPHLPGVLLTEQRARWLWRLLDLGLIVCPAPKQPACLIGLAEREEREPHQQ